MLFVCDGTTQVDVGAFNIFIDVVVAIFQFVETIITSIINFIRGIFHANFDSDNLVSSLERESAIPVEAEESIPGLKTIYDGLVFGTQAIGLGDILQLISGSSETFEGVLDLGLTTAPLIMMEFIGVNTTNSILCSLGATTTATGYVMKMDPHHSVG
jgi:hypothetical protein